MLTKINAVLPVPVYVLLSAFLPALIYAQSFKLKSNGKHRLRTTTQTSGSIVLMNAGNLIMPVFSIGEFSETVYFHLGSGEFKPDSRLYVLYEHELIFGGVLHDKDTSEVRVRGGFYQSGMQPGAILAQGVAESPENSEVDHVWRIRRDIYENSYDMEELLRQDAASTYNIAIDEVTNTEINELRDRYKEGRIDWPAQKGAPFYDVDGDGVYIPGFYVGGDGIEYPKLRPAPGEEFDPGRHADEPGLLNADQVIFFVTNDLTPADTTFPENMSPPVGLELQNTLWCYSSYWAPSNPLMNIIYQRSRFIFKGTEDITTSARFDSMFVGIFADIDNGFFADDLTGFNRDLQLGFNYNADIDDSNFRPEGLAPPAAGYVFLAGPLSAATGEQAYWGTDKKNGFKNLEMSAFTHRGGPFSAFHVYSPYEDPPRYSHYLRRWNLLRGFYDLSEFPLPPFLPRMV